MRDLYLRGSKYLSRMLMRPIEKNSHDTYLDTCHNPPVLFREFPFGLRVLTPEWLIKTSNFENLCRVQPRVVSPPHHRNTFTHPKYSSFRKMRVYFRVQAFLHLKDGNATVGSL